MNFYEAISDDAVLKEIGCRIARYRLNRNITQGALAKEAGVSKRTLIRLEHGDSIQTANFIRILRILRLIENMEALIPEPGPSPIQQIKMKKKLRSRASSPAETGKKPWSWGNEE